MGSQDLKVFPGHEGIYLLRDLQYIPRVMLKIVKELPNKIDDVDWIQLLIESFLILNSRVYKDLIPDLVDKCLKRQKIPSDIIKTSINTSFGNSLSYEYHKQREHYRNRATHGSNYLRIGIVEFDNDVVPMPLNYHQIQELPRMAGIKDFINMWSKDIEICSQEIARLIAELVGLLNKYQKEKQ